MKTFSYTKTPKINGNDILMSVLSSNVDAKTVFHVQLLILLFVYFPCMWKKTLIGSGNILKKIDTNSKSITRLTYWLKKKHNVVVSFYECLNL